MVFQKCSRDSEFGQDSICNGFGRRIRTGDTGKGVAASRDVFWGLEYDLRLAISVRTAIEYHQNIIKNGPQLLSPDFRNSVIHKKFWEFVLKNMGVENRYFSTELLFSRFKELARRLDWDDEASDLKCIIEEILNEDVETNFIFIFDVIMFIGFPLPKLPLFLSCTFMTCMGYFWSFLNFVQVYTFLLFTRSSVIDCFWFNFRG